MTACSNRVSLVESVLPAGLSGSGIGAHIRDGWLQLSAPLRRDRIGRTADLWPLLGRNAHVSGPTRLALAPGRRSPQLRADLWIEDGEDEEIASRVVSLCEDIRQCARAFPGSTALESQRPPGPGPRPSTDAGRVVELCAEAGWPCATRATGDAVATIDAGAASYTARFEPGAHDALGIVVDVFEAGAYSPDSRAAAALLLLAVSSTVRLVKGVARQRGGGETGAMVAWCPGPVSAPAVDRALASLAVACEIAGREALALGDLSTARAYLAWQGWEAVSSPAVADAASDRQSVAAGYAPAPLFG